MGFFEKITAVATALVSVISASGTVYSSDASTYKNDAVSFYETWKDKYVVSDKYVTDEMQYYVYYSDEEYDGGNTSVPVTVSEAHGYGMLIMVSMSDYDSKAKDYFDGMYRYYKAHPSDIGSNLMSWQQCDNGKELIDGADSGQMTGGHCDSATDGDMDIAYSLLMADKVWGSDGEINYYAQAIAVINDIMEYDINHEYWTVTLGDWVSECSKSNKYYSATRASDFIVQYFPVFAEATGDDNWLKVYDTTYGIINDMVSEYQTGLLPDFLIRDSSGKFNPAPANFLESDYDGAYSYNSCRVPWRISMDYIVNENEDALAFTNAINSFIIDATKGEPWDIMAGYTPDGEALEGYNDLCFTAPFIVAAHCGDNKEWEDELRGCIVNYGDDVYYGDTIKMLCLIACTGEWIVPRYSTQENERGDVNLDGVIDNDDIQTLGNHITGKEALSEKFLESADIISDGVIDVFDMVMLRRILSEHVPLAEKVN